MSKIRKRQWKTSTGQLKSAWEVDFYWQFKRIKKSGFKLKTDAEKWLNDKVEELKAQKNKEQDNNLTFDDAVKDFIKFHVEIHCKHSTSIFYNALLKKHLIPYFRYFKICEIKPDSINAFISEKQTQNLSNKTINHLLTLLHTILNRLVDNDKLNSNPCDKVKKLKLQHQEMNFLNKEEIFQLLTTCEKEYPDFYPLLLSAIFTGMRKGELLALTWQDINFKTNKVTVNKAIFRGVTDTPKTLKSIRKVDICLELKKTLQEIKQDTGFVFKSPEGCQLNPENVIKRRFLPLLKKADIKRIRFHDLRHTYASILIAQNVPIKYIQSQMGHSSIQVTLDRYGHLLPEVYTQGIKALDDVFKTDFELKEIV